MSQILAMTSKSKTLFQDLVQKPKKQTLVSQFVLAECYICGKGLHDGNSLTAKHGSLGTILLCEKHYS